MSVAGPVPSRVLVLWFPDWPLRAALGMPPHPPTAVIQAGLVHACTASARERGVRRGQRRREAQGLAPALRLLPADPDGEERAFQHALRTIEAQAPGVQMLRPGLAVLRARGVSRYHGGEAEAAQALTDALTASGYPEVRIGVGDGPFTAEIAARRATTRHLVIPVGESATFLAPLAVAVLGDERVAAFLTRLGMRTLGDFARLPEQDVRDRLGERGARLHALARGADSRPLVSRPPTPELTEEVEFDEALAQSDQIAFAVRRTADALVVALDEAWLVCTEVRIDLTDDEGRIFSRSWLHPTCFEALDLVDRVRWQLESLTTQAGDDARMFRGISRVRLVPVAVDDAAHHQPALFGSGPDERLHHALSRVQTLLGHDGVVTGSVVGGRRLADRQQLTPWGERVVIERDPALPWPGHLPDPLPAEVFSPPYPVPVLDETGEPVRIDERGLLSAEPRIVEGVGVRAWAGPWPVHDRDHEAAPLDRVSRGARLQLVDEQEHAWLVLYNMQGGWYAEGRYH
ncbi:DNA polymerase Y family protein [Microbacterium pseudoresistens]|uniref:Protein ImuB n=1 Tax=Microbacterium pseudoresistens TaxID=640634 RepID=A0A7Y9EXC9_9MICO|nr:DNA polymerase Y family protein [Microbacterium pseudoresistens]NYD55708.1 protein ImuB [Microbacterium pseudoresistens]